MKLCSGDNHYFMAPIISVFGTTENVLKFQNINLSSITIIDVVA